MVRVATQLRDEMIERKMLAGLAPKEIAAVLNISSVWVVYNTVARWKRQKITKHGKRKGC